MLWVRMRSLMVLSLLLVISGPAARAAIIAYDFQGTLDGAYDETSSGMFSVGMPFSGQLRYESTTPDLYPGDPDLGWYLHPTPLGLAGFDVQIGTFSYSLKQDATWLVSPQRISDPTDDLISIQYVDSTPAPLAAFPTVDFIQGDFDLRSPDGLLADDSLPLTLDLGDFTIDHEFTLEGLRPSGQPFGGSLEVFGVAGNLTSLVAVPVPEVGTGMLLTTGVLALAASRRRRAS